MLVECELSKLIINERREQQIVTLREIADPHREFPIVIGIFEAVAIDRRLKGVPIVRPMTHDLMISALREMGGRLDHIIVNDLRDNTFFAELKVITDAEEKTIDSRPSDAIALAVRADCKIFVDDSVLTKSAMGE